MRKPNVKLIGQDGNIFSIISRVTRALRQQGMDAEAQAYINQVTGCNSYTEALKITSQYVNIK